MAGPFYYRHYIGDYDTATKDFNLLQHGVYRRLLDGYFSLGGLPSDEMKLFRITGALTPDEQAEVRYVVALQFEVEGDRLINERCDTELARIAKESSVQSEKARKRWGTKAETAAIHPPASPPAPPAAPPAASSGAMPVKSQDSKPKKEQKQKQKDDLPDPASFEYPAWLPLDTFRKYLRTRKTPASYHAIELLVKKLFDLRAKGQDPQRVIEQSIANGWTGIFELKDAALSRQNRRETTERNNESTADRWAMEDLIG
jgi:uncharacterized protein YdaU (DUF1376 family)